MNAPEPTQRRMADEAARFTEPARAPSVVKAHQEPVPHHPPLSRRGRERVALPRVADGRGGSAPGTLLERRPVGFGWRILPAIVAWTWLAFARIAVASPESFAHPAPGRSFSFPRDHGSHPEFRLEWWYVTGHLWNASSNRFGFQTTFFRTAGPKRSPPTLQAAPSFGVDQLFLSHAAWLDVASGTFRHRERLHREGWAAGSDTETLRVRNEGSSLTLNVDTTAPDAMPPSSRYRLRLVDAVRADVTWELELTPEKPLVVFGTNGVSRKGASPTAASHYLTFPRLRAEGRLTVGGETHQVHGIAWMDHEFGSSQLAEDQAGWDWVSMQLRDGRDIMAYRMRRKDGSTDPYSTLAWVDASAQVTHLPASAFRLEPLARWRSPRSGADYPLGLRLHVPDPKTTETRVFDIVPLAKDQELPGSIGNVPYWEGACEVRNDRGEVVGTAFVELTGYAGNLSGTLR